MSLKLFTFLTVSLISIVYFAGETPQVDNKLAYTQGVLADTPAASVVTPSSTTQVPTPPSPTKIAAGTKAVTRLDIPASQVIYITGQIGANASDVVLDIKNKAKYAETLWILIDSPGGSVIDGAAIISAMEASTAQINTVCLSVCASMAFIIHQYGHKRYSVDRSILMAHPASGGVQGTMGQMKARLEVLTRYVDKLDFLITKRVNIPFGDFRTLIVSEFWIDAEDALAKHFTDGLVDVTTDAKPQAPQLFERYRGERNAWKHDIDLIWM